MNERNHAELLITLVSLYCCLPCTEFIHFISFVRAVLNRTLVVCSVSVLKYICEFRNVGYVFKAKANEDCKLTLKCNICKCLSILSLIQFLFCLFSML